MIIEGRGLEERELLLRLRETFAGGGTGEVSIEVLLETLRGARRAKAYVAMCGLETRIEEREGYFSLKISGISCRCGF